MFLSRLVLGTNRTRTTACHSQPPEAPLLCLGPGAYDRAPRTMVHLFNGYMILRPILCPALLRVARGPFPRLQVAARKQMRTGDVSGERNEQVNRAP